MKIKGFIKIALMVLIITMVFSCIAYAGGDEGVSGGNFSFSEINGKSADDAIKKPVTKAIEAVMSVIQIIATGVAIVMISVVAMKYMMAAPGDRADMKKASIQYVVGAVIVFGAANILSILVKVIPEMVPEAE